jgi:hypothetical protein
MPFLDQMNPSPAALLFTVPLCAVSLLLACLLSRLRNGGTCNLVSLSLFCFSRGGMMVIFLLHMENPLALREGYKYKIVVDG